MKILYVAMKYNYGKPEQGYGFEHYNFYDALCKMDNAGHTIIYFPFDEIMTRVGQKEMNAQLIKIVRVEKPDMCFFILFTEEFYPKTIREITEKLNVPTFNWFTDDHWRFDGYSRHWAPLFNWIGTTDSQAPAKYKAMGYDHVIKTQWACNHFLYQPRNIYQPQNIADIKQNGAENDNPLGIGEFPRSYQYDVSFVGQPHGNRKQVANQVMKAGIALECFGNGWPNGRVSQEDMIRIFGQSKIDLNLTKASEAWTWVGLGHVFFKKIGDAGNTPQYASNDVKNYFKLFLKGKIAFQKPTDITQNIKRFLVQQREQIKGRNFEVPGCGGFLLTGDADNLRDYYVDGKEIVIFKDTADMIEKIKYYLAHDKEREAIAQAGYERTIREHTYEQRFREIFKIMNVYDKR